MTCHTTLIRCQGRSSRSTIAPRSTHDHVDLVRASPTGPTSNRQPDVEHFKAGSMGENLVHHQSQGNSRPATTTTLAFVDPRRIPPGNRR
jgi:hypothetical protein